MTQAECSWIDETCRRFATSTGWPLSFRSRANLADGVCLPDTAIGALCVELPPGYESDPQWPAVRQMAQLLSELISRRLDLEDRSRREQRLRQQLGRLLRLAARSPSAHSALPLLLNLTVDLPDADGAALFLLTPDGTELALRARWPADDVALTSPRRPLQHDTPDLPILVDGPRRVLRSDFGDDCRWLPAGRAMGIGYPVNSGSQPVGTFWTYFTVERELERSEADLLAGIAGLITGELARTVSSAESEDRQRLRRALQSASRIEPDGNQPEFDFATGPLEQAICRSARDILGGDLCQLIPLDEIHTLIVVGDAAGDGIPAAMIRARLEGALQQLIRGSDPALLDTSRLMSELNGTLHQLLEDDQFCSLFLGVWNRDQRKLRWTNAGHPAPLHVRGRTQSELKSCGMLLGILPGSKYFEMTFALRPGDWLILYTDGVSDGLNHGTGRTLSDRVQTELEGDSETSPRELAETLWSQLERSSLPDDDRSLMILRLREPRGNPVRRATIPAPPTGLLLRRT